MTRMIYVAAGVLSVGLGSLAHAEEVSLAAHLTKGETASYHYESELSQAPTGKFGNPFYVNYTLDCTMRVRSVDEKYTDLDVVFSRIVIDSTLGAFDSDKPADADGTNLVAQAFRPAIGEVFKARLNNADMRLLGVTGPQLGALPDMMIQLYERVLGDKHLSESFQPAFRLKDDPATASPGDTWSQTLTRNANLGQIEIRLDFTLKDVDESAATVDIGGEHTVKLDHETPVSQRMTEQKVDGQATWSIAYGMLESYRLEKTFTLAAGDENLDLGAKVVERETLERKGD